ncbi:MAG: isopeptide-forming domain-containing fimbrial protein [Anaerovoracaceae bacterium]
MRKSNRLLSRLTGMLAALTLVVGLMPATALAADREASITITEPVWSDTSKDWAGTQANAYLVLDQVNDRETDPAKKLYSVTTGFDTFFNIDTDAGNSSIDEVFGTAGTVYLQFDGTDLSAGTTQPASGEYITFSGDNAKALDKTYGEADLVSRITGDAGAGGSDAGVFYSWIEKYIERNNITTSHTATADASVETQGSVIISGLDEGYYAVDFKNVPSGLSIKQGVMIATTGTTSAVMNLKAENLPFEKQISEKDANVWFDELTAETGDVLDYKLTAQVPTLTDYDNLTKFTMSDTLAKQEFDPASVQIAIDDTTITRGTDDNSDKFYIGQTPLATLNPVSYDDEKSSFTLTFEPSALEAYEGKTVTVTYSARLTTDAVKVNVNDAELVWSNNGSDSSLTDSTKVYTYGIELTKNFSDATVSADEIGMVTFRLYRVNGQDEELLYFTGSAGSYILVSDSNGTGNVTADLKLNTTSRKLTVVGLDDDETYILKETATADGYNLIDENVTIDLEAQADPNAMLLKEDATSVKLGSIKLKVSFVNNTNTTETAIASVAFELYNQKGFSLPKTGDAGTWALTVSGILLIASGVGLVVVSRRKKSSK